MSILIGNFRSAAFWKLLRSVERMIRSWGLAAGTMREQLVIDGNAEK
jgi:hypothetical protein